MRQHKTYNRVSILLAIITLIGLHYSFGTFGLLNLLGVRMVVQAILIAMVAVFLLTTKSSFKIKKLMLALMFAALFGIGGLFHGGHITKPIEALLMIFIFYSIASLPDGSVLELAKLLVICASFFCGLVSIAYFSYQLYPDQYQFANFNIYDSTVGDRDVTANTLFDLFSFTSGDGFVLAGETAIRLKGYSNEPSSTIVHYLSPAALAFFIGGRYLYLGIFVLLVNVIAISSLVAYIIVLLSILIFILIALAGQQLKIALNLLIVTFLIMVCEPTIPSALFSWVGESLMQHLGYDLLLRKGSIFLEDSSFFVRVDGIRNGLYSILVFPIGYSYEDLPAGAGLLYTISATSGWIGVGIFVYFLIRLLKFALLYVNCSRSLSDLYALALTISLVFVTTLISGYGWERPAGIIMLVLLFRILLIRCENTPLIFEKINPPNLML